LICFLYVLKVYVVFVNVKLCCSTGDNSNEKLDRLQRNFILEQTIHCFGLYCVGICIYGVSTLIAVQPLLLIAKRKLRCCIYFSFLLIENPVPYL